MSKEHQHTGGHCDHGKANDQQGHNQNHQHDHAKGHAHNHSHGSDHQHGGIFGEKSELIFSLICGISMGIGYALTKVYSEGAWYPLIAFIAAYFFGGFFTMGEAVMAVRKGQFEVDFLMLIAAVGAAILNKWLEGSLLLFLFSLGHSLEHMAMNKAQRSIQALAALAPKTALVKINGNEQELPVEQLKRGDLVIIKPNSRIPADGVVVNGTSAVNQAPITGESIPVDKQPLGNADEFLKSGNERTLEATYKVFAGTINGTGLLEIKVLKASKDSSLARLMKLVQEAEQQQSPTQQFTKKIERYYVPAVLILVLLLMFGFVVIDETFKESFYRAMAVLVAASPCALAISTPSAVLSGVARAARQGVLIKGGRPLEELGSLTALAFDKTGTLTEGRPVLNAIVPLNGVSKEDVLRIAVAVERSSDHPLASAIVKGTTELLNNETIPAAQNVRAITGKGIEAEWQKEKILIGNIGLFTDNGTGLPEEVLQRVKELQQQGNTTMIIKKGDIYAGILGVMDLPRKEAEAVLQQLKKTGIRKMVMLTGDNQRVADAVSKQIGLTDARGDLLPEEKVKAVEELKQQENKLAMIGDGVNDAPAMARSTVGIAMGAAGSDIALETADIALMGDKLSSLPFAVGLSRAAKKIIRQNLFMSLGMVAILIPLTILGFTHIGPAVALHEGSTLVVVLNALRLLAYKEK